MVPIIYRILNDAVVDWEFRTLDLPHSKPALYRDGFSHFMICLIMWQRNWIRT